jgi:hypothetical protein
MALSSTAIVLPVLEEREEQQTPSGRLSFAVLLAQDLALVPILFGIGALAGRGEEGFADQLLGRVVPVAVVFAILIASGPLILRPLLKAAARAATRELFVAACLLVVLVTGLVAQSAGLSMALGAFIAGLLLAETEYQREIQVTIDPFKGLFLGAFFLAVGIELDLGLIAREPLVVLGAAAALIAGQGPDHLRPGAPVRRPGAHRRADGPGAGRRGRVRLCHPERGAGLQPDRARVAGAGGGDRHPDHVRHPAAGLGGRAGRPRRRGARHSRPSRRPARG